MRILSAEVLTGKKGKRGREKGTGKGDGSIFQEAFGPTTVEVKDKDNEQPCAPLLTLRGQLTAAQIGEAEAYAWLEPLLEEKVGRVLINGLKAEAIVAHHNQRQQGHSAESPKLGMAFLVNSPYRPG
ncbi:Aldehyde Dehydrogenase [Pseudomonas syringae pv. papulans]|nr:Aldehyde Dehydrogenase [Pseudomonas syringae pv. papulans]RMN59336.1 Aldehyde Dehydrogenase [Pseudomonas syringae pv. papulans]